MKNTKLSEVKRVTIPVAEPKTGDDLNKAMIIADDSSVIAGNSDDLRRICGSGLQSYVAAGGASGLIGMSNAMESQDGTINKEGVMTMGTEHDQGDSVTDSDMDEAIKTMGQDRKVRNVMHRVTKDWSNKFTAAVTKEPEVGEPPKSGGRKR